jgi:enamine deaminase RidA (YjgF/YER057c/UK114 family)
LNCYGINIHILQLYFMADNLDIYGGGPAASTACTKQLAVRENTNLKERRMSVYERIASLGITLPEVTPPVAAFVPFVRSGNQIFVSGHIAKENGKPWVGQFGLNITTELGIRAARSVAIDLMATLNLAVGDLNNIRRIIKLMCLVNSAPTFTEQHLVANGASELLAQVFGKDGTHARSAFGVAQVPFGSCVEIDLIAEVAD